MGQKINPNGFRLGVNRDWEAKWYADKNYADTLNEDLRIRKFISEKLADASVSTVEIERAANRINISIHTAKPGMVIGKGGKEVEALRKQLSALTNKNVHINIVEIKKPDLDAKLVGEGIARQLEARIAFRRATRQATQRSMRSGAKGIKVQTAGRLNGADMSRVNANGYFDEGDNEEVRYQNKKALNNQRTIDYKNKNYERAGGCLPLPVSDNVPFFVKDYSEYYKGRAYHERSLNSNEGWNKIGCMSFINDPILTYSNEIRSAVLMIHGEKAHSCYFSKDAYANMIKDSKYKDNKELMIIPNAVHTDLYDNLNVIPFDKIDKFFKENLK